MCTPLLASVLIAGRVIGWIAILARLFTGLIGRAINRRDIGKFPNLTCHAGNRYLDRYHDRLIARWI